MSHFKKRIQEINRLHNLDWVAENSRFDYLHEAEDFFETEFLNEYEFEAGRIEHHLETVQANS
jgi:hypothetical protein